MLPAGRFNVVDVKTSEVVYSVQGAGEYALSDREVLGFGGTSGYDSTLNGKVLDLATREAVNKSLDHGHDVARVANRQFAVKHHGLLYGPYHPQFRTD